MKVKTVHYINGINVADMTKSDCIACIASAEAEVSKLEAISASSKVIDAEVNRIETFISDVVKHLDAKV